MSKALVDKLQLRTKNHPFPYKIGWIKRGAEIKVTEICCIHLSIGKSYRDAVTCDVGDMDACHVLLGRPWQYDVDVIHKGRDNTYEFSWNKKKIKLVPMQEGLPKASKVKGKSFVAVPAFDSVEDMKKAGELLILVFKG